ncbi:MAG: type II toxin-antitoxin system PemK/MazF family toxin [Rhizomicrobium sp.]
MVVVPFPYSDRLAEKRRPAVVVSSPVLASRFGLVWLAMVTSASNRRWNCDVSVSDLGVAGLPAPSLVRAVKIATVDSDRIVQRIGRLTAKDARAVEMQLKSHLA